MGRIPVTAQTPSMPEPDFVDLSKFAREQLDRDLDAIDSIPLLDTFFERPRIDGIKSALYTILNAPEAVIR